MIRESNLWWQIFPCEISRGNIRHPYTHQVIFVPFVFPSFGVTCLLIVWPALARCGANIPCAPGPRVACYFTQRGRRPSGVKFTARLEGVRARLASEPMSKICGFVCAGLV